MNMAAQKENGYRPHNWVALGAWTALEGRRHYFSLRQRKNSCKTKNYPSGLTIRWLKPQCLKIKICNGYDHMQIRPQRICKSARSNCPSLLNRHPNHSSEAVLRHLQAHHVPSLACLNKLEYSERWSRTCCRHVSGCLHECRHSRPM